jgi:xanthine dehydrogenase YagT iron-sulfur-binding subunit
MIVDRPATGAAVTRLRVNGDACALALDARVTLLDALREYCGLTGTKKGCDHGQCGACTVHVDGRRVLACLTLTAAIDGSDVTTVEGLARDGTLHPMQEAFVACDALQCGYCTAGQIMSAIGAVDEGRCTDDAAIAEAMSGNLCRCGAYPMIRAAVARATR